MKMMNIYKLVFILILLNSSVFGQQIASEFFGYAEGSLNGLNGGDGWGGAWEIYEGDPSFFQIKPGSLSHTDINSVGNYLEGTIAAGSARARRLLETMWVDDGQCWISFLMDIQNPYSADFTWQGLSLYNSIYEHCLFGKGYGHPFISILNHTGGDVEYQSTTSWDTVKLSWYVIRIDMSGDDQKEKCYMWLNPSPDSEPAVADTLVSGEVNLNDGFDTIVLHFGHDTDLTVSFDDIRLGTTFADVSPAETHVNQSIMNQPEKFILNQNYPNPFNPVTTIGFSLETSSTISLKIYNLAGQVVETLAEGFYSPGQHHVQWNASNQPSGIYFYELQTDGFSIKRKLVLQK